MKKINYALLGAFLASSAATANEPSKISTKLTGFYAGAALGYGTAKVTTRQIGTANGVIFQNITDDISIDGTTGGLFMGYGRNLPNSCVYLGLELGYFLDKNQGKLAAPATIPPNVVFISTEVRKKDSLELAARLGITFNNYTPYLKIGWANTKVEGILTSVEPPPGGTLEKKFLNKRLNGFLAGIGIDVNLSKHWLAGLESTFVNYRTRGSVTAASAFVPASDLNNWSSKAKLKDRKVSLRIAYHF